jgi:hypothetical protein
MTYDTTASVSHGSDQCTEPPMGTRAGDGDDQIPAGPGQIGDASGGTRWGWAPDPKSGMAVGVDPRSQIADGDGGGPRAPVPGKSRIGGGDGPPIVGVCRAAAPNAGG